MSCQLAGVGGLDRQREVGIVYKPDFVKCVCVCVCVCVCKGEGEGEGDVEGDVGVRIMRIVGRGSVCCVFGDCKMRCNIAMTGTGTGTGRSAARRRGGG